ncbi:MAG: sugar ABC transporter ATP-binding protein, partial [Octadecabacter sp.]|nr:sugar ABC transporter ATP-binding protein [Octadecabacter sp.]
MSSLVKMQGINKSFAGVAALRSAGLDVKPGEVHALIGQNGAGKSTFIKILTGVYRRDEGSVQFDGQDIHISSPREAQHIGIATIYQELNLVPQRSVTENVTLGYEPRRKSGLVDWPKAHRRTREILTRFGVDIDVKAPLGSYSTAIQQLVAIARAVSLDAKLVIMDEATSSLDATEVKTLFDVVRALRDSGVTVLYISHFMDELFAVCDRVTIMRDGQTVGTRSIPDTSKLELIADMLGRNMGDIEAAGVTELGGGQKQVGELLFAAKAISTGNRLPHLNMTIHRGEIVGLGGLLGSGRTEAARAIFGVDAVTAGAMTYKGKDFLPSNPQEAIKAGIAMLSEDRKLEGIVPDMSVR